MLPLDETVKKTNSLKIKGEHIIEFLRRALCFWGCVFSQPGTNPSTELMPWEYACHAAVSRSSSLRPDWVRR